MEWIALLMLSAAVLSSEWAEAQRPFFGSCPKVKSARNVKIDKPLCGLEDQKILNFNWHVRIFPLDCLPVICLDNQMQFLGKWYEVERSFYIYEIPTSCTTLDISRPDNATKELQVSIKTYNRWTRRPVVSYGKATPKGDGSAVLDYRVKSRLPDFFARFLPGAGRYTLLATDHDTYAVVYSCSDLRVFHTDLIWVLGRKPDIPVWARAEAYDKLATAGFGTDQLTLTHRKNCPDF